MWKTGGKMVTDLNIYSQGVKLLQHQCVFTMNQVKLAKTLQIKLEIKGIFQYLPLSWAQTNHKHEVYLKQTHIYSAVYRQAAPDINIYSPAQYCLFYTYKR